jgi:hypothetical protein
MKMQKKKILIATAVTITIFLSMFSAINLTKAVSDNSSWYTVANGNLNSDYYTQYPFEMNNVSFGFSQFGELIGIAPGSNQAVQGNWVGMSYNGRDPFAPNTASIPQNQWINGWFLYISYIDPNEPNKDRNLWAFALFSDGHVAGGDWIINVTGTPTSPPYGGRKTNGMVVTDPLQVLYNGPREVIMQATNHIYDNDGTYQWPVVDLIITMIFDKVSKQVVLYKDVKTTIDKLNLWGKLDVQLSDREEYDLGPSPNYASYAHFYEEQGVTDYTPSWSIAQNLTTDYIETQVGSSNTSYDPSTGALTYTLHPPVSGDPVSEDYMKVYVNNVFQDPSVQPVPYTVNYGATTTVTLNTAIAKTDVLVFKYKYVEKSAESEITDGPGYTTSASGPTTWYDQYDYAQVISSDNQYVAWTAMWPPTSSHTVDGILNFLQPLYNVHTDTLSSAPKRSPLIIGQWDIAMDPSTFPMFRAVEVKGIANDHDATDPQELSSTYQGQTLDIEAQYQLDSVFQPYDLNSAITKNLNTQVDYYTITASDLLSPTLIVSLTQSPVYKAPIWETYNSQSERVFIDGVLQYPIRTLTGFTSTYELYVYSDGTGYIYFPDTTIFSKGDVIKIIYATDVCNVTNPFTLTQTAYNVTSNTFDFGEASSLAMGASWEDTLDVSHNIDVENFNGAFTNATLAAANTTWTYSGGMVWEAKDFTVYKEDTTSLEIGNNNFATVNALANGTLTTDNLTMSLANLRIKWEITGPDGTYFTDLSDVQVSKWDFFVNYTVTVKYQYYSNGTNYFNVSAALAFTPRWVENTLYKEEIPGRYEWGIVGTNAATVDSAGLAMITAALKDKEVEYGISGGDIAPTVAANEMPSIFSPMSTSTSTPWSPYYYSTTDLRVGLRDDWDPVGYDWQVAGANLVGSGGPLANMLAYYGNDFATAFYGLNSGSNMFTPYAPWQNAIVALSCWNSTAQKAYVDTNKYGYAVVSTFEDINGTTGLLIWGNWGRDTYYAANWFYMDLINEFQSFPCGATSIVLQIVYNTTTYKPTKFTVIEVLGTISETGIVSATEPWLPYVWGVTPAIKGGIHPDP